MSGGPITIRPYRPGDEEAILASFNLVFRQVCGPDFRDRDLAFWRWQFEDNPEGHRIRVAVAEDGTIAAHYGGVPYRMATPFGDRIFVHIVDSFVHPDYRKGLKRPGIFVRTAVPWFSDCYKRGDAVPYGFPVPAAERIGQRYLFYFRLRVVDYLMREVAAGEDRPAPGIEVVRRENLDPDVEELFAEVAARHGCLTRRSRRYLTWRYLETPGTPYEIHEARRAGRLCGLMVLRPHHELVPGSCGIADWLVAAPDSEVTDALLARATQRAREEGRKHLLAVLADPSPEHAALRARGFRVEPSANTLERRLNFHVMEDELTGPWLEREWYYVLGDSDLI